MRIDEKIFDERYEFGDNVLAIDVCTKPDELMGFKKPHIHIMGGDESTAEQESGHKILDTIEFNSLDNLYLFQQGLELMQRAISDDLDLNILLGEEKKC